MTGGVDRDRGHQRILLVEDSRPDIQLMEEAFAESGWDVDLSVIRNGDEAVPFLKERASGQAETLPNLILLDLNLPRRDGREAWATSSATPS